MVTNAAVSDLELLAAWGAGDVDCGNLLIERHFDLVYRFFRNKAVESDIEDLVQQTFLACLEARTRYAERASLKTFLLAIARNQLLKYYRGRHREPLISHESSLRDNGISPTGALAKAEDQRLLLRALRHVPLDAQVVLELTYAEGMAVPEVAEVLGLEPGAVHTRLSRARDRLRESLRELAPDHVLLAERAGAVLRRTP